MGARALLRSLPPAPVRNLLIGFVVLDLVVLAAFSVRVETTTTTTTAATPVGIGAPVPSAPAVVPVVDGPASTGGGVALGGTPLETPPPAPAPAPTTSTPSTGPAPEPVLPDGSVRVTPCPIEFASSTTTGGLQSLIDFAPAFGPFSAEAFAAASAYQPALQLIGPILAKYPQFAPTLSPLVTPLISTWQGFLDQGFALLGPLYVPHRQQVLAAETKLAAALAPYAQKLTASPLGGCVIALQNALLTDGTAGRETGRR